MTGRVESINVSRGGVPKTSVFEALIAKEGLDGDYQRSQGIHGPDPFAYHRTPGFGDTNWVDVISALRKGGYRGSIDIEGWHDPVYRDDLEMTGQVHSLNYLKRCRGGAYVANPA